MDEIKELTLKLARSTGNYVIKRIHNPKNKEAYKKAMHRCIEIITENDIEQAATLIKEYSSTHTLLYPKRFFFIREDANYHVLACENALDIVDSMNVRFITGGFRIYQLISGGSLYEDESVF